MSAHHFILDPTRRSLEPLQKESMQNLGFTEPGDLEAWIASCRGRIFGRSLLWISRQDWVEVDRRSDLVGLDTDGALVITELKRGEVPPEAIFQVLNYAAAYSTHRDTDLQDMLLQATPGQFGTTPGVADAREARDLITSHVGQAYGHLNQRQVALLVGESFHPQTLRLCAYLNQQGCRSLSLECWAFHIFPTGGQHHVVFQDVTPKPALVHAPVGDTPGMPAPEAPIQTSRLNPVKMKFREQFIDFIKGQGAAFGCHYEHKRGWPNYTFRLQVDTAWGPRSVEFTARLDHPRFECAEPFRTPPRDPSVRVGCDEGLHHLTFPNTLLLNHLFDPQTGRQMLETLRQVLG